MKIKILFFGSIGALAGKSEMILENITDVEKLKKHLSDLFPDLPNYTFRIAVNKELVEGNTMLNDGDELAIMPPFAGG
jgi:molybdopterin synthase sulfur carrier subunit